MFRTIGMRALDDIGIKVSGVQPWDIQFVPGKEEYAFRRMIIDGSLGIGETYMEGVWRTNEERALAELCYKGYISGFKTERIGTAFYRAAAGLLNLQRGREHVVGEAHYDLFSAVAPHVLGGSLQYSCAYWKGAESLDEAQLAKMELIARKLKLKPGMRVLDVGCGWGTLAMHLAEQYKVQVVGLTISKKQRDFIKHAVPGNQVEVLLKPFDQTEWQTLDTFDRIVSVGMFEHVGADNYTAFFKKAHEFLKPGGIMLLHTIGGFSTVRHTDPWIHRYIFPNGKIPALEEVEAASREHFEMRDMHEFGLYYEKTLKAWYENFTAAWPYIQREHGKMYDDVFYRQTVFYLLACSAAFRAGVNTLWQFVFTKRGENPRMMYESVR